MYIYLIRHGETAWNLEGRIQGREDIPLCEEGRLQARRCAGAFAGRNLMAVFSSPLSRARETAGEIAKAAGAEVFTDDRFTERDFGSASGVKVTDIFDHEKLADDLEPLEAVSERMLSGIREHAARLDGDFAVVSHGGSINAVLKEVSGGEIGSGKTRLKNACISILRFEDGKFKILKYNLDADDFMGNGTKN